MVATIEVSNTNQDLFDQDKVEIRIVCDQSDLGGVLALLSETPPEVIMNEGDEG